MAQGALGESLIEVCGGLIRLARVVAWLESLAAEALDRDEAAAVRGGGSGARFARGEGVPRETRQRLDHRAAPGLGRAAADAIVTKLDPDAPTRCELTYPQR